jgi:Laminin B (Domain IV)
MRQLLKNATAWYFLGNDNYGWNAFLAPSKFLGNQSAAYLGSLTFDLYDAYVDSTGTAPAVMISDGTTFLYSPQISNSTPLGPPFHTLSVQFLASTGWSTDIYGSSAASELQMQSVLAHLQILAIDADWQTGVDDVHLDNVSLVSGASGVPEPASGILALAGGLGLLLAKRRKLV